MSDYKKNSLSLRGAISMGTGVMIGAAIFALVGQVAELSGNYFPVAFMGGALITGFSSYAYVKMSNTFPSAGGIGMYLVKAYGKGSVTATAALFMAFAMVINQSLTARTFGSYTLQLFDASQADVLVPVLGVVLLIAVFLINISGNEIIQKTSLVMALIKIGGIAIFAIGGLWAAGFSFSEIIPEKSGGDYTTMNYMGALALAVLAYAGFTTITNSGAEIKKPHKNVGRAIIVSLLICMVIYLLVAFAVSSSLDMDEIIKAKDYALAEAARPAFKDYGVYFTVAIAIVATISGLLANVFAVSRMTAMLTEMKLIPHRHFGMPGRIQKHMLVYTVVFAITLTVLFDLTRIASIGIILYLVMDIVIQWGVLRHLRKKVNARPFIIVMAIILDAGVLVGFLWTKAKSDMLIVVVSVVMMAVIFLGEKLFLSKLREQEDE